MKVKNLNKKGKETFGEGNSSANKKEKKDSFKSAKTDRQFKPFKKPQISQDLKKKVKNMIKNDSESIDELVQSVNKNKKNQVKGKMEKGEKLKNNKPELAAKTKKENKSLDQNEKNKKFKNEQKPNKLIKNINSEGEEEHDNKPDKLLQRLKNKQNMDKSSKNKNKDEPLNNNYPNLKKLKKEINKVLENDENDMEISEGKIIKKKNGNKEKLVKPSKKENKVIENDEKINSLDHTNDTENKIVKNKNENKQKSLKAKNLTKNEVFEKNQKKEKIINKSRKQHNKNVQSSANPDAPEFDKDKFFKVINEENIKKAVKAFIEMVSKEIEESKNKQIFNDYKFNLNISQFLIPQCPKRLVKLKLKHSLLDEDDETLLIVKDLVRGSKVDYDPTIEHYENLLRKKGITGITVMPFAKVKREYGSFTMKKKLSCAFNHYLCDGSIISHVFGFLGQPFRKARSAIHSVRMDAEDLKTEIENKKSKTSFKQGGQGPLISIAVGTNKMDEQKISDNILFIIKELEKDILPGGLENIQNMHLRIDRPNCKAVLSIYTSMCKPPANIPNVIGPKEKKLKKLAEKVNKNFNTIKMGKDGKIRTVKQKGVEKLNERKRKISETQNEKSEEKIENAKIIAGLKKLKKEGTFGSLKKNLTTTEMGEEGKIQSVKQKGEKLNERKQKISNDETQNKKPQEKIFVKLDKLQKGLEKLDKEKQMKKKESAFENSEDSESEDEENEESDFNLFVNETKDDSNESDEDEDEDEDEEDDNESDEDENDDDEDDDDDEEEEDDDDDDDDDESDEE